MKRNLFYNGSFYPSTFEETQNFIEKYKSPITYNQNLFGLILPHAGWIYSGKVALKGLSYKVDFPVERVILLGPSHRVPFNGCALCDFSAYKTLDKEFLLDYEIIEKVKDISGVIINNEAHLYEHSLEVELEFIKYYYPEAKLVPIIAGANSTNTLKNIIHQITKIRNTLIILSSDLSHYLPYNEAIKKDKATLNLIINKETIKNDSACGSVLINALTDSLKEINFKLLEYKNSGDTAGDKNSVVGYGAIGIFKNG